MKENKLTLADIAYYLPYGLEYIRETDGHVVTHHVLADAWDEHNMENGNGLVLPYSLPTGFKPLLRPMSMLYQTIVHDGKEEVPIVELAKIADGDERWFLAGHLEKAMFDNGLGIFEWDSEMGGFTYEFLDNTKYIHNQIQLFDYLYSRFFDYRDLIGRGLAIKMEE